MASCRITSARAPTCQTEWMAAPAPTRASPTCRAAPQPSDKSDTRLTPLSASGRGWGRGRGPGSLLFLLVLIAGVAFDAIIPGFLGVLILGHRQRRNIWQPEALLALLAPSALHRRRQRRDRPAQRDTAAQHMPPRLRQQPAQILQPQPHIVL